jgi:hypothetical protein
MQLPNKLPYHQTLASQCSSYRQLHSNAAHPQSVEHAARGRCNRLAAFSSFSAVNQHSHMPSQASYVACDTITAAHAPAASQPCAGVADSAWPAVLWVHCWLPPELLAAQPPFPACHLRSSCCMLGCIQPSRRQWPLHLRWMWHSLSTDKRGMSSTAAHLATACALARAWRAAALLEPPSAPAAVS